MAQKKEEQPVVLSIDDLVTIFQFNDPALFQRPEEKTDEVILSNSLMVMEQMGSLVPSESQNSNAQEDDLKVFLAPTGMSITLRTFHSNNNTEEQQDFVSVTISQFVDMGDEHIPQEERYMLEPVLTFTGQIIDGYAVIIRESIVALPPEEGETEASYRHIGADNTQSFKAVLLCADACFRSMLEQRTISLSTLEKQLKNVSAEANNHAYNLLCDRTRFDTKKMQKNLPVDQDHCSIPTGIFENIFQLENPNVYSETFPDDYNDILENTLAFLKDTGSKYAAHFEEGVQFSSPPAFVENGQGDSLWSIPYVLEDSFGVLRSYQIIIVAGSDPKESTDTDFSVRPFVVLIGEVDETRGEYKPLDAIALYDRPKEDGSPHRFYLSVSEPDGFLGVVCYAESAMTTLLLQRKLESENLSVWLENKFSDQALDRYDLISRRDAKALTNEIMALMDDNATPTIAPIKTQQQQQEIPSAPKGYYLN